MISTSSHDGLRLVGKRTGSGPGVLFVHANGFCKELWNPIVEELSGVTAIAVDQRGHGGSQVGPPPFDWWDLGRDSVTWGALLPTPRVGVGHSSGGAALAMAEILQPGTWDHLVLVEPIILPGPFRRAETHSLVEGALRRRTRFDSREQTRSSYAGRGPFASWTDRALDLYVEHGFRDDPDGSRALVCDPEIEAEFYRMASAHGAWDRLGEIACPVTLVIGEHSDSHPPQSAFVLAGRFRDCATVTVPGAGHFVPMEKPDEVRDVIRSVVTKLTADS